MKKFKEVSEQYREEGRFKPVKPHMVKSVAAATPRKKSDSANVKLKEDEHMDKDLHNEGRNYHDNRTGFAKRQREDDEYHVPDDMRQTHTVKMKLSKDGGEIQHKQMDVKTLHGAEHAKKFAHSKVKEMGWTVHEEVEQVDEIVKPQVKSDLRKLSAGAFMKKHGVNKLQAKGMAEAKEEETPPFDPDPPKKKSVVPGKFGSGYSTARHLARQAMQKQSEKYKKPVKESLEESRKAEIVKELVKKKKAKSEDAFQPEPELSSTLTKV